jgi:hypothetical protein
MMYLLLIGNRFGSSEISGESTRFPDHSKLEVDETPIDKSPADNFSKGSIQSLHDSIGYSFDEAVDSSFRPVSHRYNELGQVTDRKLEIVS